jgi:uncharacterized protein
MSEGPIMAGAALEEGAQGLFSIADLMKSDAFPHAVRRFELVETHISWVVLTGDDAYKIKKPVRLDFLDASTLDRRRQLCEEELRLNRRLAPDLYIGVETIGRRDGALRIGAKSKIVEYAVHMRQFDRADELSALLARHAVSIEDVEDLAAFLASFHQALSATHAETSWGTYTQIHDVVLSNLATLTKANPQQSLRHSLSELNTWTQTTLAISRAEIESRRASGAVRECHGDLHARNIVRWRSRLVPFDCLEFDPAMRWIDVASEMAFLYMDLVGHDRRDLASAMLSRYLEIGGDYEGLRVLRFYAVYRALVRAKVDALQVAGLATGALREELLARFAGRVELARQLSVTPDPFLVIMCGVSGSGKSWLSERLVPALGAIRVRSDLERKRITGRGPLDRSRFGLNEGLYAGQPTDRTYARLFKCAQAALVGGQNVIVDATFLHADQRELLIGLASKQRARFLIVSCGAAPETLRERVRTREIAAQDPSEATVAILDHQLATRHAFNERERTHAVEVDTSVIAAFEAIQAVRRGLDAASPP